METYNRLIDAMPVEDGGLRIEADDSLTLGINPDGSLDVILLDHHLHEVRSSPVTPRPSVADDVERMVDQFEKLNGVRPDIVELGPHHTLTPCDMFEGYVGSAECRVCGWPVSRHAS